MIETHQIIVSPHLLPSQHRWTSKWCSLLNLLNIKWSRFIKYLTRTIWSEHSCKLAPPRNITRPYDYFTSCPMGPDNIVSLFAGVYIAVNSNGAIIFSIRENCSWLCHSLTSTSRVNCNLVQWLCPATGVISIQLMLMLDPGKHTGNTVLYEYHVDLYLLSHTNKSWISITNRYEKQFYYWRWW